MAPDDRNRPRPPHGPGKRRGPGRPAPPPEATGAEALYIHRLKESATPLVVHLRDGSVVRGHIEYYDRDMVKITRLQGPHLFVRKVDIAYWTEDERDNRR
jgi:hypothetical protein